jgi:hypothetical protein
MPDCPPDQLTIEDPNEMAGQGFFGTYADISSVTAGVDSEIVCIKVSYQELLVRVTTLLPWFHATLYIDEDGDQAAGFSASEFTCEAEWGSGFVSFFTFDANAVTAATLEKSHLPATIGTPVPSTTSLPAFVLVEREWRQTPTAGVQQQGVITFAVPLKSIGGDAELSFAVALVGQSTSDCAPHGQPLIALE